MSGITDKAHKTPAGKGALLRERNSMPNVSVPIAIQRKDEIIRRISEGEQVGQIAASLGVNRSTIHRYLADNPEYQDAQIDYHANRLDAAEQMILDAEDAPSHTRARSYWTSVSWRAEREQSRIWGSKQELTVNHNVSIIAALEEAQTRVIDGTCRDLTPGTPSADLCED